MARSRRALFDRVVEGRAPSDSDLAEIVEKCVAIKARIVEKDEFETTGERALLNFGHTLGHAIEKATGYKTLPPRRGDSPWACAPRRGFPGWQPGLCAGGRARIEVALACERAARRARSRKSIPSAVLGALGNDKKVAADGENRWVLLTRRSDLGRQARELTTVQRFLRELRIDGECSGRIVILRQAQHAGRSK